MPSRILDRNVGGNTTYARELASRLDVHGIRVGKLQAGPHPIATLLAETVESRRRRSDSVIHFVADTGPMIRPAIPSVVTVHGVASRWIRTARNRSQETVWRSRVAAAIRVTDRVITVSESSADDISSIFKIKREEIAVVPHGIDSSKFSRSNILSAEVSRRIPDDFLLYIGNIEPRKNLIELVHAVEMDISLPPLVIAGKPAWNYRESLEAINSARRTIYLGFVADEDRAALMQACTAFVFPSLYEGFGFPVLEAMAAGAPVVTTDRGSLREVAGPAMILDGVDRESINTGLRLALADASWLREAGHKGQLWADKFSWDASVARHAEIYRSLLR